MRPSEHVSVAYGLLVLTILLVLHQMGTSLQERWALARRRAAEATPVCSAPIAVKVRHGLRLGCADEPALRACAAHAYDRVDVQNARCTVTPNGMPIAWYRTLGLRVNVNRAEAEDLQALVGVGERTAQAIVAHRHQHGFFATLDALGDVRGVGPAKVAALRQLVTVDDGG